MNITQADIGEIVDDREDYCEQVGHFTHQAIKQSYFQANTVVQEYRAVNSLRPAGDDNRWF